MQINLVNDSSANFAPAGFTAALNVAAQFLDALIINPITVNIEVGFGDIEGSRIPRGVIGEGGPIGSFLLGYAAVRAALPGNILPASDPTPTGSVEVTSAQRKALGLIPGDGTALDGAVGFSDSVIYTYDANNRGVAGAIDFIGVALHELTHAMGRIPGDASTLTILDLYRFSAAGQLALSSAPFSYFSIDNGATNLDVYDSQADTSDWIISGKFDAFDSTGLRGAATTISQADRTLMSVLGFALACFAGGTRIRTRRGDVPVEALIAGQDVAITAAGRAAPIVWIGRRAIVPARLPNPDDVMPVRIRAGAIGPGQPARDLALSPDHALFLDGVLIPARLLVNGRTITRQAVERITYWHVELDRHDVLLAEGVPCESYLDTGNRGAFENGGAVTALHPAFSRQVWQASGCAELVERGVRLAAIRQRLLNRATMLGHVATRDAGLEVWAGGQRLDAGMSGPTLRVQVPSRAGPIRLLSRSAIPAETRADSDDPRRLGVAIAQIRADGRTIAITDARLTSGWHDVEYDAGGVPAWRWTDGDAGMVLPGVRSLELTVAASEVYWIDAPIAGRQGTDGIATPAAG